MKKLFILLACLGGLTQAFAQIDISADVVCPPGVFVFENGGASLDSYYVSGSPDIVVPMTSLFLNQGQLDSGYQVLYLSSHNRFLTAEEIVYNNVPPNSYWRSGLGIPTQAQVVTANNYIGVWNFEPGLYNTEIVGDDTFNGINMMLDMDYYDQDSIVFVGPPFQNFDPCHVYGLFMMNLGYIFPGGATLMADDDPSNDLAVVPVFFDCYGGKPPGGTGALSLYKQNVELNLFPNPATQQLNIHQYFERNAKVNVTITDLSGRIVLQKDLGKIQGDQRIALDIVTLPKGAYMLELSSIYIKGRSKFVKKDW